MGVTSSTSTQARSAVAPNVQKHGNLWAAEKAVNEELERRLKMTYRLRDRDILLDYEIVRDGIWLRCFNSICREIPYNIILNKFIDWKAYFEANNLRN